MKTLKQSCTPRASAFDPARRDTVLDLSDLVEQRIDPAAFFAENHITEGMKTLLTEGFRRLEGKSAQGVFKLTQAMGGGKTHNLLALGLLARHPEFRAEVMGDFYTAGRHRHRCASWPSPGARAMRPLASGVPSRSSSAGASTSRTTTRRSPPPARRRG